MDDKKLPLAVAGGTAALVILAAVSALTGQSASEQAQAAGAAVEAVAEEVTEAAGAAAEAVEETVAEAADDAAEAADAAVETVAEAADDAADAVEETVAEAADDAAEAADDAVETVAEAADDAGDAMEETVAEAGAAVADFAALSPEQTEAFGAQVRSYLMENPQVIMDAVAVLEQREAEQRGAADVAMVKANADALFDDGFSWVGGNPDGDFTIVEFTDYRCGYCRRAAPEVEALLEADGNIRLILKEFPILGEASLVSSRFAIATLITSGPEAYKAIHDALMTLEGEPTEPVLSRLAATLGLDVDAIFAETNSEEVTRRIAETRALAQQMQISGTPTFVFGSQMVRGYAPLEAMMQIVSEERAAE